MKKKKKYRERLFVSNELLHFLILKLFHVFFFLPKNVEGCHGLYIIYGKIQFNPAHAK